MNSTLRGVPRRHEFEPAVRLPADEVRQAGDELRGLGRHAATGVRFEPLHEQAGAVRGAREATQIECEGCLAIGTRAKLAQRLGESFARSQGIIEREAAVSRKSGAAGVRLSVAVTRRSAAGVPNRFSSSTSADSPSGETQPAGKLAEKRVRRRSRSGGFADGHRRRADQGLATALLQH